MITVDGDRGRLIDLVDNAPVGVIGRFVAFPMLDDAADSHDRRTWASLAERPERRILAVPTRGLFAEAKLAHCNACERIDPTRYWDWQQSPCARPPAIQPVELGSRRGDVSLAPAAPDAGLAPLEPPGAPDPGAMLKTVMDLLGTSDIFRDMSGLEQLGPLLEKLVEGAVELEKARLESASSAAGGKGAGPSSARDGEAVASGRDSGRAADSVRQPPPSTRRVAEDAALESNLIDSMRESGRITPDRAERAQTDIAERVSRGDGGRRECDVVATGAGATYVSEQPIVGGETSPWVRGRLLLANFDVCGADLKDRHTRALDELLASARAPHISNYRVESIVGRASQTGQELTNERLSLLRAEAVAQYLSDIADHIARPPTGIGATEPIRDARGREEPLNRSVEVEYYMLVASDTLSDITPPPAREGGTDRWEVRLISSAGVGAAVGAARAVGELRRQTGEGEPPARAYRFTYYGFGLVWGLTLPGADESAEFVPFTTSYALTEEDFDGSLCRLTVLGYGFDVLDTPGYSLTYLSFPMVGPTVYLGGASYDTGVSGGTSVGFCDLDDF